MREANFKETEIGKIPVDWEYGNAGDYIDFITGFPFKSKDFVSSGVKLLRGSNVKRNNIDWSESITQYLPEISFEHNKYVLEEKDIVISMDGSLVGKSFGQITSKDLPALLVQRVARIRGKKNSTSYLKQYYCSEYFTKHCDNNKTSSAIPHISPKDILEFKILIPTNILEQEKIAEVLSDTDLWIESTEALLSKKRLIKKGAMQKLLAPKEDWEVRKLGEVCDFLKGRGLSKSALVIDGDKKCIHYGELFTKYSEKIKYILSRTNSTENIIYSKKNDVLMPTSDVTPRGLATASCVQEDNVILGGDILIIRFNKNIDGVYFSYFITNNKEEVLKYVSGSTVYHLYGSELKNLDFTFPPLKTQQEIAEILSAMDLEIESLENRLQKARQLKQGMMQDLLSGKVRLINN